MENFQNSSIKVHRLTFFPNFMPICPVTKKTSSLYTRYKTPIFAAILRPFGPGCQNFGFEVSQTENVK